MLSLKSAVSHWRTSLFAIVVLAAWQPQAAMADNARAAFNRVLQCVHTRDAALCRNNLTADSKPLYDRFMSYGLVDCLPPDTAYVSQQPDGEWAVVRASVASGGAKRFMRLFFKPDQDSWKLDIPASLQRSMGDNWQEQLNMTEQLFLMMRSQMGDQLNCAAIQALGRK